MYYDNIDRLRDLVIIISGIALCICMFGYGEWRYREGIREGRKQRRMVDRKLRRGIVIYRK